jgi:CDP-diglyceride synthetase
LASLRAKAKPRLYLGAGWWAAALLLLAILAFWPVYIVKLPFEAELFVNLHTAGVVLWMLLLIAQPWLIGRGRRSLHKKIGGFPTFWSPISA